MQQELWRAWRAWSSRWMSIDIPPRGSASWVAKTKNRHFHDKQVTKTPHDTKIVDFPKTLDEIQGLVLFWICDAVFWVHWRLLGWTFRLLLSSKRLPGQNKNGYWVSLSKEKLNTVDSSTQMGCCSIRDCLGWCQDITQRREWWLQYSPSQKKGVSPIKPRDVFNAENFLKDQVVSMLTTSRWSQLKFEFLKWRVANFRARSRFSSLSTSLNWRTPVMFE